MRRSAPLGSLLTLLALGTLTGCGDDNQQTSGSGANGGSGGQTTTTATGGSGGSGANGGSGGGTTTDTGGTGGTGTGGNTGGTGTGGNTGGSGGGGTTVEVIDCNVPDFNPPADAAATCEITTPGTAGVVLRGTLLLPNSVVHKGEVVIGANGKVTCAACDCSAAPNVDQATVVTCADGVISPGLINPHDHITFAQNPPKGANTLKVDGGHETERYDHRHQWRKGQDGHTKLNAPGGASTAQILLAELRFVMSGATTAASAGGKAGLLRNVDTSGLGEGVSLAVNSDTFPLDDSGGAGDATAADGCSYGAAAATAAEAGAGDAYLPHISEGINPKAHTEFLCTSVESVPLKSHDIIGPKTSIIHGIGITAADVGTIRTDTANLVWSPRSNIDLYGNTAQVTMFDTLGVPIALGTDWLPSGSMNMLRELRCADELNTTYYGGHFSDYQLWQMATGNAARVIGASQVLGSLAPGFMADVAIFNGKEKKDHRAVVAGETDSVVLVMRGGKILYGDTALVEGLRPNCETLDVCGAAKRACVSQDAGAANSLATLVAASQASYPLFFCDTPAREPSCIPYRNDYKNGPTADDSDGDGVPNATDDCPDIFNPTRPMDAANPAMPKPDEQSDFDGDGKGDVCDKCPLDAMDGCSPNDFDGDGTLDAVDNCPNTANPTQSDADNDKKGDVCDKCPDDANPGATPCPAELFTIKNVRDPSDPKHPAMGDLVSISNAYVTAVRPKAGNAQGFYIQDDTLTPFSGIFIFTAGSSPTVAVGNRVTVTGAYSEYFGLSELTGPNVIIDDAGTTLPFGAISVANPAMIATGGAMAEGYESMLVKVSNLAVTVVNSDGAQDFDEFTVTGALRIDDILFDNMKDMGLNNVCAVGKGFTSITGVHSFSFDNFKLAPRFAADIELLDAADANYCKPF